MTAVKQPIFLCENVKIGTEDKSIVRGVDLTVYPGEIHALMGPNGSGKSTFASGLMGHPAMNLEGHIYLNGEALEDMPTHERAKRGLFLGFQYPVAIPGVTVASFLRAALAAVRGETPNVFEFRRQLEETFAQLGVPWAFADRYLNDGFSGGEKKRLEILQMALLKPKFIILDEIDSGLDVDALKVVSRGIHSAAEQGAGVLMVTHYQRLLDLVTPTRVHYFMEGRIAFEGGVETVKELEANGYDWLRDKLVTPEKGART
ncbi:MAG: Fe-S cluster assembly ATPase SufC [Deltaproteobacteria bacterium]|nr:Fe-S cluster assembly ATPase SufC [Deltaproteobacteria bacterium]MBN2671078.1 Fe-S cluster assembly ATPase SufC [Deltaproteobacteria bacterium]